MKCEWVKLCPDQAIIDRISQRHGISGILARILANNGIVEDVEIEEYLYPERTGFYDPFLMQDVDKVVDYLIKIRQKKEPIVIYGDYDVDGVTSTALVYSILHQLGWKVNYYIPSRLEEGYGLSQAAIIDLFNKKNRNIITVDCGISSFKEVDYANFLNFKVIITDHHEVQEKLPNALAVVNPKRRDDRYPDKGLAGVGVAFKVMDALLRRLGNPIDIMEYLDLVTLGTVADIVPLKGENRVIVRKGMRLIAETKRIGLKKLMEISGINVEQIMTQDIGFKIAPRLNAVGRLESAYAALKLLLSQDEAEGMEIARYLSSQNEKRQFIENQIYQDAETMLKNDRDLQEAPVIVLWKEDWHPGVIGIVSSRLSAKFYKPTLLLSLDYKDGVARGSGRSIEQVNIMDLLSRANVKGLEYGGHPMAAGFTLPAQELTVFREQIFEAYRALYKEEVFTSKIYLDAELPIDEINESLLDSLEILKPFGQCNHEPAFLIKNASVDRLKILGNHSQHIRLILKQGSRFLDCIGFNLSERLEEFRYIRPNLLKADCVGNLKAFWHFGSKQIQFSIKDIHFYLDPAVKEVERTAKALFSISKKNEPTSAEPGSENLETLHADMRQRLFSKYPLLQKAFSDQSRYAIFASPKTQDAVLSLKCLNAISKGQRLLLVTPSASFSVFRSQVFKQFDIFPTVSNVVLELSSSSSACTIVTIPYLIAHYEELKRDFHEFVFLDIEYLFHEKMEARPVLRQLADLLRTKTPPFTYVGSFLLPEKKAALTTFFPLSGLLTEPMKSTRIRLVDRRGIADPLSYIQQQVKNGEFVCVSVQKPERTVGLTKEFGKMLSEHFHNGEVVFYNQQLKPFQKSKIEDLVMENKARLLITTPDFSSHLKFPANANLCILDPLKNPLEVLTVSNAVGTQKSNAILHLLYDTKPTQGHSADRKHRLEKMILSVLKLASSEHRTPWEKVRDLFVSKGETTRFEAFSLRTFVEEIAPAGKYDNLSEREKGLFKSLQTHPDFIEFKWEWFITDIYERAFYSYDARKIVELFDLPYLPLV
ncbi:MAG TPA: single-stranded-DNA-specific exonuclease RecJ [Thermotogota bacterium]|nr:single-stranded-DNA-specific exonuclease RecJ [Thermotogota bacterium]